MVEMHKNKGFCAAVAELNGWRNGMEDAHLIYMKDDWAFFGVFDGHGGHVCSAFVAKTLREKLEKDGCPVDDAAVKKLVLSVDEEFLNTNQSSGSTGTICIVRKPEPGSTKHTLHVINIGDSRVMLGNKDGSIVDGGGTDQGLTTDHKPDHPTEEERIYRCGGSVEKIEGGVARVNGDLAVSRSFGDRDYKMTGGPGPEDRPVTADPEMGHFEADPDSILLLVCDGVSEGNFSNSEVVKFAADTMLAEDGDIGAAAREVCLRAVERDSKDNVTCMIVTFQGGEPEETTTFTPGQTLNLGNKHYRTPYADMAQRAGFTLAEAVERRYNFIQKKLSTNPTDALQEEADKIGTPEGEEGSEQRAEWFANWVKNIPEEKDGDNKDLATFLALMGRKQPSENKEAEKPDESGYTWSQHGSDVQVIFKLETPVTENDIKVTFHNTSVKVVVAENCLLDGVLPSNIDVQLCTWLFDGKDELQLMLTKEDAGQKWETLIKS